tara:strand:+ start:968 stop:1699 length:732 start_codon:yes stop_codon:yes gene_type:complete
MKFGFLSTLDNPLLSEFISSAILNEIKNIYIIIDTLGTNKKDQEIFKLRTNGKFGNNFQLEECIKKFNDIKFPFYFVKNHNSNEAINLYKKLNLNCLLNTGTPRKLSFEVIDIIKNGIVNVHPGILPQYRGCSCIEWAIINDDPIGNTAHFMDINYDTGPIIKTEKYNFSNKFKYSDIRNHVYLKGCNLAAKVLKGIEKKEINIRNTIKQNPEKGKYWDPIPYELESKAISKANEGRYKFQID